MSEEREWCLTCRAKAGKDCYAHDKVCVPAGGWGCCMCRTCRRVIAQMQAQS